jgi:FkbM family methyltransferase
MNLAQSIYIFIMNKKPLKKAVDATLLKLIPASIHIGPAIIELNPTDPVVSGALTLGVYEQPEVRFFMRSCRSEMIFVDIGANVGLYSGLAMHLTSPSGRIVALEPHAESREFLHRTLTNNQKKVGVQASKFVIVEDAASDVDGQVQLFINDKNKGDHRLYDAGLHDRIVPIYARTLDNILYGLEIDEINYLKIDVQGYEVKVIRGAREIFRKSSHLIILTEFWPKGIRNAKDEPLELLCTLAEQGFALFDLRGHKLVPISTESDFAIMVERYHDHLYTNLVCIKGYDPKEF